jgi:hypothetical protein
MLKIFSKILMAVLATLWINAYAQDPAPKQQDFTPKSGKGRVVIVISGQTGPSNF